MFLFPHLMNFSHRFKSLLCKFVLLALLTACSNDSAELPEHIRNSKQLIILTNQNGSEDTFQLEKEVVFEDSLMLDQINAITTDSQGRVYIAGESWGRRQLHIFEPDGSYADSLGTLGSEPGEFQSIDNVQIENGELLLFDRTLQRLTRYNFQHKSLLDTLNFEVTQDLSEEYRSISFSSEPVARVSDNTFLMIHRQIRNPAYEPEGILKFSLKDLNEIDRLHIADFSDVTYMIGDYAGSPAAFTLPLPERTVYHISESGNLYVAHTSEFFIKSYSLEDGSEGNSYYFAADRSVMNPKEINHPRFSHNRQLLKVRESAEYPEFWPVLYSVISDDEDRIWISKISDDRKYLEWWIVDDRKREITGRLTLPISKKIIHIKNGMVYTVEKDDMGFEKVVRYRLI